MTDSAISEKKRDCKSGGSRLQRAAGMLLKLALAVIAVSAAAFAVLWVAFPFPRERLEQWHSSPLVTDVKGRTLVQVVGEDGQWQHTIGLADMSKWLVLATVAVEDSRFYEHRGVDVTAAARAMCQNLAAGRVVSGASTIDMQICRMMDSRPRTLKSKLIESFRALQLCRIMSKDDILELYLNVAPYGGNIRGVEAASNIYFGKRAKDLSLCEATLIAGLPQSPSRYRPDKYVEAARRRQATVLKRMFEERMITAEQLQQAAEEPVAIAGPHENPRRAPHAGWMALQRRPGGGRTTIDLDIQEDVERYVAAHLASLPRDSELAVVVIDIADNSIRALVGSGDLRDPVDGQVNGVTAMRSPGSTLKPFIYAAAFEAGRLNSDSIVYDVPISRGGWSPSNFDRRFHGEITAGEALRKSLNIPAILVAEGVGLARCCAVINACGVRLPDDAQRRGGLALAVGAVETSLLDLTNAYATLGREGVRADVKLFEDEQVSRIRVLSRDTCRSINWILSCRRRMARGLENSTSDGVPWFMWKTGTSSGRRDAWAVGHNYRYAVGVWVGRFRGTGHTEYVGAEAAEPLTARLLCSPLLRNPSAPAQPKALAVKNPLKRPRELHEDLRILSPDDKARYLCVGSSAVVRLSASRNENLTWFLNDRVVQPDDSGRLTVGPGDYELRCVACDGSNAGVRFSVFDQ